MRESDIAYIAGLFDGEGSIYYKNAPEKKKKHTGKGYRKSQSWRINCLLYTSPSPRDRG